MNINIPETEIQIQAVRSQGPGGQHVNKVATAVQLRFDIHESSLPDQVKEKLLALNDQRISKSGIVVIKAQAFKSQEKNRQDAVERLKALIQKVLIKKKKRKKTRPSRASVEKRLDSKSKHGRVKELRKKIDY